MRLPVIKFIGTLVVLALVGLLIGYLLVKFIFSENKLPPNPDLQSSGNTSNTVIGDTRIIVVKDEFSIRGNYKEIVNDQDTATIVLDGELSGDLKAKLTQRTVYGCQKRYFTDQNGRTVDVLRIQVNYRNAPTPDPSQFSATLVGSQGLETFVENAKPGQPVVVHRTNNEALSVNLISDSDCSF